LEYVRWSWQITILNNKGFHGLHPSILHTNFIKMKNLLTGVLFSGLILSGEAQPLWLRYPAVSPDGSQIVFTWKGDLYRVPVSGGTAIPITTHEAHETMPVWSPDGKHLAFASDRFGNFDVFQMALEGGEPSRLTQASAADYPTSYSPDGKSVLFQSARQDPHTSVQFPSRMLGEVYSVPAVGGKPVQVFAASAEMSVWSPSGNVIAYQDQKGYEDPYRKHHQSSIARDIWTFEKATNKYKKITSFKGEDRNPVFASEKEIYYLSEQPNSFNIFKLNLDNPAQPKAITSLADHPVRHLSAARSGLLCFSWNGEIYTVKEGSQPQKVSISIASDARSNAYRNIPITGGVSEMAVSPNGKEVASIVRGEVFVTSVEGGTTKRITNTPQQERSVSFSPDGKKLLYSGERNGSWDVFTCEVVRKDEPYFYASTILKEEALIATPADEFQAKFSPDGKEVAFYEERTTLKVFNLASKSSRTIVPAGTNYSYSDGDQWFDWSPDSKWLVFNYLQPNHWMDEIGIAPADGKGPIRNISENGYDDGTPKWMAGGKMILFNSWRDGMKSHGSWGAESDVYALFPTRASFDRFQLSKQEFTLLKEKEDKEKKEKEGAGKDDKKKKTTAEKEKEKADSIQKTLVKIEFDDLSERKARLTLHSSFLSDAILSQDGEKLYYLCRFEKGFNLWVSNLREKGTKILAQLDAGTAGNLEFDKEGKSLFMWADGRMMKVDPESGKMDNISLNGEMQLRPMEEKAYMFDHAWRQVVKKFYRTDLHGVRWDFYKKEYERFLPHISNNYDFEEMLSELLGELNASHTGAGYRAWNPDGDKSPSLGLLYDLSYQGPGLKVAEVLKKGPLDKEGMDFVPGMILEKIDGIALPENEDWQTLIRNRTGQTILLSFRDSKGGTKEVVMKPISSGMEGELLYHRWCEARRAEVEKLSKGRLGYVHVRGMDDASFRVVYEEVLGRHANKEALIVDTRFNGGGWLHDDLATFLSGKKYVDMQPRGQKIGFDPQRKWTKPSVVLVGESNYSDAHFFPFVYKELGIGKLIGMPVPGTATAVWWEPQIDQSVYFGIPQVGIVDKSGKYLENQQLEVDVEIAQDQDIMISGRDQQIEKAVEVLLKDLGK
jgi:Tol biopolymer transport system component/C-terminal processing protease CtpA/Prc